MAYSAPAYTSIDFLMNEMEEREVRDLIIKTRYSNDRLTNIYKIYKKVDDISSTIRANVRVMQTQWHSILSIIINEFYNEVQQIFDKTYKQYQTFTSQDSNDYEMFRSMGRMFIEIEDIHGSRVIPILSLIETTNAETKEATEDVIGDSVPKDILTSIASY